MVAYQIYVRSFQDSDGDGVGDLPGVRARLDHLAGLGVGALWLSPIHPSPQFDLGYDIADYLAVDPVFGTLGDLDALVAAAHARGIRVLMDLVPCHTSTAHPWFRERPDFYVWADEPNNWRSAFGGPAWSRLGERWYLHSFYPEQADLDWRNPDVVAAMQEVVRFWLDRGVDGYRVDAIDRLLKDPELRDDPPAERALRPPGARGQRRAGADQLAQRAGHRHGARRDPRGRRRRAAGGGGLPAVTPADAVPRAPRRTSSASSCCTRAGTRASWERRSPACPRAGPPG